MSVGAASALVCFKMQMARNNLCERSFVPTAASASTTPHELLRLRRIEWLRTPLCIRNAIEALNLCVYRIWGEREDNDDRFKHRHYILTPPSPSIWFLSSPGHLSSPPSRHRHQPSFIACSRRHARLRDQFSNKKAFRIGSGLDPRWGLLCRSQPVL